MRPSREYVIAARDAQHWIKMEEFTGEDRRG